MKIVYDFGRIPHEGRVCDGFIVITVLTLHLPARRCVDVSTVYRFVKRLSSELSDLWTYKDNLCRSCNGHSDGSGLLFPHIIDL